MARHQAIGRVPFVRYALAVAAIGILMALLVAKFATVSEAVVAVVAMVFLMLLLRAVAPAAGDAARVGKPAEAPAVVLTWLLVGLLVLGVPVALLAAFGGEIRAAAATLKDVFGADGRKTTERAHQPPSVETTSREAESQPLPASNSGSQSAAIQSSGTSTLAPTPAVQHAPQTPSSLRPQTTPEAERQREPAASSQPAARSAGPATQGGSIDQQVKTGKVSGRSTVGKVETSTADSIQQRIETGDVEGGSQVGVIKVP
jgi:hypothetical protein